MPNQEGCNCAGYVSCGRCHRGNKFHGTTEKNLKIQG